MQGIKRWMGPLMAVLAAVCLMLGAAADEAARGSNKDSDQMQEFREFSPLVTNGGVNPDGEISAKALEETLAAKTMGVTGEIVYVRFLNGRYVDTATLDLVRTVAQTTENRVILQIDTSDVNEDIQGKIVIEPAALADNGETLKTGVYLDWAKTKKVSDLFEGWFDNQLKVIALDQQADFASRLKISAKVKLGRMNKASLRLYSYNEQANTYKEITDPDYTISDDGYLSFYTKQAGYIIVTDKALTKK